jgi:hypothetical protein
VKRRDASALLASLERIARRHGPGLAARKLELLGPLARARLQTPRRVMRLHELLCYLDAYPDNRQVRARARRMLNHFHRRGDLRRHRAALAGTGIAGTDTPYRFFFPTAEWITGHWPGALVLDRADTLAESDLLKVLPSLLEPAQAEWVAGRPRKDYALLDQLAPEGMTDADFVNGLIAAMPGDEFTREAFGDRLDLSYVLRAGRDTPERTTARLDRGPVHYQRQDLRPGYPDLRTEARRKPARITALRGAAAVAAIRLARVSMITRERDVAGFQFANPRDVHWIDDGEGLAFAMMGMTPQRRATLAVTYTALTLKNGVPIGYVQAEILGGHAALSFNTFAAFRGGEAARVFARFIAITHQWLGCTGFSIEPYQLGQGNEEGIDSGAWWFYCRLGFRPRTAAARRLAARELQRRAADARYRSSTQTLRALARAHMLYSLDGRRRARLPQTEAALAGATRALRRFRQAAPAERRQAAARAALRRLAGSRPDRLGTASRAALERWAGLVLAWTARGRWSRADRRALLRLIVAKAAATERRFQQSLLACQRLRRLLDC